MNLSHSQKLFCKYDLLQKPDKAELRELIMMLQLEAAITPSTPGSALALLFFYYLLII